MMLLMLIAGISGSRLLYLIEYSPQKLNPVNFFAFEQGGLTFYGAVLGGIISNLLFLKLKKISFWRVMDCVGFGLPLGIALARTGCFLNGCCYGLKCSMPWGVVFPLVSPDAVHPTQLYESLSGLIIFLLLQKFRHLRQNYGEAFLACMSLYAFFRFFIEFWRADNPIVFAGLKLSQLIAIAMIISAYACWQGIKSYKKLRYLPSTGTEELEKTGE